MLGWLASNFACSKDTIYYICSESICFSRFSPATVRKLFQKNQPDVEMKAKLTSATTNTSTTLLKYRVLVQGAQALPCLIRVVCASHREYQTLHLHNRIYVLSSLMSLIVFWFINLCAMIVSAYALPNGLDSFFYTYTTHKWMYITCDATRAHHHNHRGFLLSSRFSNQKDIFYSCCVLL